MNKIQTETKTYPDIDIKKLGKHYLRHISAMTEEDLYEKWQIAAQLALRDYKLEKLIEILDAMHEHKDNEHCYICDLIKEYEIPKADKINP